MQTLNPILSKFDALRQYGQKPLYMKASGFIRATTDVLNATIKDCSPVAYLMSITQVLQARLANKHQKPNKGQPDLEVLAYCYAAIVSTVPLAVVQSQAATVSTIGQQLIAQDCTETSAKYGVQVLQFLLHSKTEAQWQVGVDADTFRCTHLLFNMLLETKRGKAHRQAVKSACLLLKNKRLSSMPILTSQLANIVSETFFGAQETTLIADSANETRQTTLLKFLAAGVQVVPEDICCIMASQLVRLVEKTTTSHSVKTLAYLTLEVMYASRKLTSQGDHIDSILRSLFENMELPDVEELGQQDKDEDMVGVTNTFANNQSEQRVVAYIQATAQVCLNYSSLQKTSVFNEYIQRKILSMTTLIVNVFCEYLVSASYRIRHSAFSALRLVFSYGLTPRLFISLEKNKKPISEDAESLILNFDALTITEEIKRTRQDKMSSRTPKEKLLIHMCYLLTERFTKVHDSIFRLLKAFIQHLSIREDGKVLSDFLLVLSEIKVKHYFFDPWTDCIGAFLMTMGCDAFFKTLPLDPVGHDMNSLTYAQDSKSFLMPILKRHLKKGDLEFFVNYFIPIIKDLEAKIKEYAVQNIHGNALKAQKYKVIVIQIWELLPAFCRYNSPKLTQSFTTLISYLEPMVNKNVLGLRILALRAFSEIIIHCRVTPVVTDQIKKTRVGLCRISLDYVNGLSTLYQKETGADEVPLQSEERSQILTTLQDFSSISKSVKLSNLFLNSFAELVSEQDCPVQSHETKMTAQHRMDILIAMMEKVKLNRDNYVAVMSGVKVFVEHNHTQKRGYKLLARVIEKYQLQSIDELFQIKTEITPLMKGSASKQRLQLIKSYIDALIRFSEAALVTATEDDKQKLLTKIMDLIRSMIIELIGAINNSNLKIRNLSGEIFLRISLLLSNYKATHQLLQILLVGFAGTSPQTQSCTIRALIYNVKANIAQNAEDVEVIDDNNSDSDDEENNPGIKKVKFQKLVGSSPEVQDFMNKVTRIIALFLKDSTAPKELHRSVLKFTKIAITYLDFKAQPDLMPLMLSHCFALKKPQMYSTLIRRIVSKLMFRCGVKEVKSAITDKSHLALVSHIDREKRKKRNAGEKRRMIAELGKGVGADKETQSLFADIGAEMGADQDMDDKDEGDSSEESEDDEDDVDEEGRPIQGSRYGIDKLASSRKYDIPRVTDIPVISELARMEREKKDGAVQKSSAEDRLKQTKDTVTNAMQAGEQELETHFVENPFIKLRQKNSRRELENANHLGVDDIKNQEDQDIILLKDHGKYLIKDLEQIQQDKEKEKLRKRNHQESFGYGEGLYIDTDSEDEGKAGRQVSKLSDLRSKLRKNTGKTAQQVEPVRKRDVKKANKPKIGGGRNQLETGAAYLSKKGKGDVLRPGTHEPYAYIKLNPEMLNPRKKTQAVNNFAGIVSHGKKLEKRTGKRKDGILAGMSTGQKKKRKD